MRRITSDTHVAGHFGELLQGRLGPAGPVALVSLPCPALSVSGTFHSGRTLNIHGGGQRLVNQTQARALFARIRRGVRGRINLRATMPAGGGAGASTAALVALARLTGSDIAPEDLAKACIAVEGASDPLMFPAPERLLWASRIGEVMEHLPPLPAFDVIGGFFGPHRRTDPADTEFPDIADLVAEWKAAAKAADLSALAHLSSQSAQRTLAMRHTPDDPIIALATELGALGIVIAHTGSARGLIFSPNQVPQSAKAALRAAGARQIVQFNAGGHV